MNISFVSFLIFTLSFLAGLAMLVEGCLIVLMKKQITPLPSWVLFGLGGMVLGGDKSRRQFLRRNTPQSLRRYAVYVLVFGPLVIVSSFVYLLNLS